MIDKERILDALDDFKDEYGTSFSSAYAEETDIIEDALDLYYEKLKEEKKKRKEDAISREAMLNYQQYLHGRMSNEENHKLWEFIKDLPSVMPKAEPCEDAVSREAVLAIAGDSCLDLDSYEDTKEFCGEIKELSSVTHTQKTGRWIFVDDAHEHARCSECGYGNVDLFNGRSHNYCPNCGAKMGEDALTTMMSISDYKLIKKEGYNDGYYWDTRYCFELNGKRYILTDIGSCSGYIPSRGEIMEVENDENLDMLLKDWHIDKIDVPEDLSEEGAIKYVKQLKDSGTAKGEAFVLWSDDEDDE